FTSWTPYSNICPITGWTGCEVTDCGVNFIDKTKIVLGERFNASGTASVASSFARTELIRVKPSTDYYFTNVTSSNTWSCVWWYDEYGRNISWAGISGTGTVSGTKTSPANAYYVGINIYASDIDTTMLTEGTTAPSSYIPYNGTTYPITWQTEAGTVYGGTVDLVTGVLTAYPYYTSYNGETLVGPWVSSIDEYIEGRIPTTGAQVVDLGGTPTTYQLTPTQIHALLGQNKYGQTAVT
ncbi:MAG: hypothetical protein IKE74_08925, partial [Mogibacterium sp.]|nr:hypothetical protein [Mogibacterium sp.]